MKKKLLIAILAITSAFCCAFGLTACDNGKEKDNADKWGNVYTFETAYAAAKELGYGGTLEEFIASIKGKDGTDGKDGIDGKDGVDGKDGLNGTDGKDGIDGVGIKNAFINENGELIIVLTNDSTVNCGNISAYYESLHYAVIKEENEVIGYSVIGLGTVTDTDLVIPSIYRGKPVKAIAANAFDGCNSLTSVTIPAGVTFIGDYAFDGCRGLTSVTIPDGVTEIGVSAFSGCSSLTSVSIPESVTTINNSVFGGCSGLTSVTIPDSVTEIGDSAFSGCSSLTSVTLPADLTSIGVRAFNVCSGLTSITIPDSVTTIERGAFQGCSRLTSVTIPDSVTSIGNIAFIWCSSLTDIYYGGTEAQWNSITKAFDWDSETGNYTVHYLGEDN